MSKIYLVVCRVFNNGLLRFSHSYISFQERPQAQIFSDSVDQQFSLFSDWWDSIEEPCRNMNHDEMLAFLESQTVPREWKMQCSDYRLSHPEFKLEENFIKFDPEIQEILLLNFQKHP